MKGKRNRFIGFWRAGLPMLEMLTLEIVVMVAIMFGRGLLALLLNYLGKNEACRAVETYDINGLYMFIFELLSVLIFACFYLKKYSIGGKALKGQLSTVSIFAIVMLFAGAEIITSCGLLAVSFVAPDYMEAYGENMSAIMGDKSPLILASALFLAPVAEEFIYRGITMELSLRLTKRFFVANMIQAFFFGLAHLNLVQGIYAFLLGLVLGYVRKRYNSLFASMLGHIVFNVFGSVLINYIFAETVADSITYIITVAIISTLLVAAGLFIILKDKKSRQGAQDFDMNQFLVYEFYNAPVTYEE